MLKLRSNKMQRAVNYVLCAWSGPRRVNDPRYNADRTYYLRKHVKILTKLDHNLAQISIMVPHNHHESSEYRKLLTNIPKKIQKANVVIVDRPNVGMSYGSFSDAYKKNRTKFDYYFYVEDDYCFMQDYFDEKHIHFLDTHPDCGYICGFAGPYGGMPYHASISVGMMSTTALEKIWASNGEIPHGKENDYRNAEEYGQVGASRYLIANGFSVLDWRGIYKIGYRNTDMTVNWCHPNHCDMSLPPIFGPI